MNKVLNRFCEYVSYNWNASFGHGNDEDVLAQVAEEYYWLLEALEITKEQFIKYYVDAGGDFSSEASGEQAGSSELAQ